MPESKVRVLIVDDHPLLRDGTRAALDQLRDIEVVGVAADGATGLAMTRRLRPDVLLLDLHLPDMNGIALARDVRSTAPSVAVVALTGHDDPNYPRALKQVGARGYLQKTASAADIAAAVRAAAAGTLSIATSNDLGLLIDPLTERELEVLQHLAAGERNLEIAERLTVSKKTVDFHVGKLLAKLGARSRTEAVAIARRYGLLAD